MADTVLGKVSCVPRGDYDAGTAYTALDIVGYSGGSYMALRDVQGVTPGNDGTNWMQLAGPGTPGAQGERGEPGAAAGFGTATVTVDDSTGTPAASVELSGPDTAKVFAFAFSGLKGETGAEGEQGPQGNPGTSVKSIRRTSGTGAAGTTDTYTMYDSEDAPIGTFTVYNGSNGEGSGDFMANGTVPMTGNLSMGGNRVTGLGAPHEASDAVRQQDLEVLSDELDAVIAGTTPIAIPVATEAKAGAVKPGSGLGVTADGTLNVTATAQDLGAMPEVSGGTAGQVLTKTTDGQAWQDAPDGLPEGGTTGQVLTKTESGAAWADAPETGVVNFNGRTGAVTPQAGDYTADMVGARPDTWTPTADDVGAVPTTRTVNGNPLSEDIALNAADVGARAASWTPTAAEVGALPISGGTLTGPLNCGGRLLRGVANPVSGQDAVNLEYARANFAPKDSAGGSGKRTCRFVVGTSTAGWTDADCDYLCDGTDDQVEINAAIQALPSGGGEIVILDGTYNITATIAMNKDNVKLSGNGNATVLRRMWDSSTGEGVITITATNGGCCVENIFVDGNKSAYNSSSNNGIYLSSSRNNTITGNTCNNNSYGIYLSSRNNTITGNTCNNNDYGIYLPGSNDNTITGNTCNNNNDSGIRLSSGSNNTITGNTCNNNSYYGICLIISSNNNTITGNTCIPGEGTPSEYTSAQYTILLYSTDNNYNLISSNNIMGKNYVSGGGTGNTFVNNKYN